MSERRIDISDLIGEPMYGRSCPSCYRNDGSHALGCPVDDYIADWKRIRSERAGRDADEICKRLRGSSDGR